jgi:drug/metabolite transporter (DMT)-like permease
MWVMTNNITAPMTLREGQFNVAERKCAKRKMSSIKNILPWLLLVLLGFIWGTNFLFMKLAVNVVSPLEVAWLRVLFGAIPITAFALIRRSLDWNDWRYLHHFSAMALLANVGPYTMFVIGTANLPSGIVGAISGAIPFITAGVVAAALPSEALTRSKLIGIAIGFAGVLLVAPLGISGASSEGISPLFGIGVTLAGAVSYALALVYAKRFVAPLGMGAIRLASYQMVLAFLFMAPFSAPGHWAELTGAPVALGGLVIGLGLLGTGIAFVIYYYLIETLGALKAASVYYVPPVVALAVGALFAGEVVEVKQIIGALLILAGIFYANRPDQGG